MTSRASAACATREGADIFRDNRCECESLLAETSDRPEGAGGEGRPLDWGEESATMTPGSGMGGGVSSVSIWFSLKLDLRGDGEEGDAYRGGCAHCGLATGVEGEDGSGDGDEPGFGGTGDLVKRALDGGLTFFGEP